MWMWSLHLEACIDLGLNLLSQTLSRLRLYVPRQGTLATLQVQVVSPEIIDYSSLES
jgi:hypothetical protein